MQKYFDKLMNRMGYYKFVYPKGSKLTEGEVMEVMDKVGSDEKFRRLLRDISENDVQLYFMATSDRDRHVVRGGRDRCLYFLSLIQKAHAKTNKRKS